jgi:hypothetical protein
MAFIPEHITANGTLFITCPQFISYKDGLHDLVLEWRRRDGIWDREALGQVPIVSSLHEFQMSSGVDSIRARGRIDPDFWCFVHGEADLSLSSTDGTISGHFSDKEVSGTASCTWQPAPRASRGAKAQPIRLLEQFTSEQGRGRLYDFSHAGRGTAHELPDLPVIAASDFGVITDSGEECHPGIQRAIDAASAQGGGIVQLPAGVLDANVDAKLPALLITSDQVYLRGAGSGPDGTLLINQRYSDTPDPAASWRAGEHPLLIIGSTDEDERASAPTLCQVSSGDRCSAAITVDDSSALAVGQFVLLRQCEDEDGSLARDLVLDQVQPAGNYQGVGKPLVTQIAQVRAIDGDKVTLDAPLHRSIDRWRSELCDYPMLRGGGVSDVRISGHWGGFFIHHKNGEHDNGWDQIKLRRVAGGLVSNVVSEHTTSAVGLGNCLGCVVRDCRIEGNLGHNGFIVGGACTGNLLLRCHGGHNMHAFNIQGTICGNAVVDCSCDEASGVDLHGCIGCDTLVDSLSGGVLKGGGGPGAVPPRHGLDFTLWNWRTGHYDPYKVWQRSDAFTSHDQTPGYTVIGMHGSYGQLPQLITPDGPSTDDHQDSWGWAESHGQRVTPRSLYRWLCERPDAD